MSWNHPLYSLVETMRALYLGDVGIPTYELTLHDEDLRQMVREHMLTLDKDQFRQTFLEYCLLYHEDDQYGSPEGVEFFEWLRSNGMIRWVG